MQPSTWIIAPDQFQFRVEFVFVTDSNKLLKSKTWELRHHKSNSARVYLLQADARLLACPPLHASLEADYLVVATKVASIAGELQVSAWDATRTDLIHKQLAKHPVTLGIQMDDEGLHLSLFVAQSN